MHWACAGNGGSCGLVKVNGYGSVGVCVLTPGGVMVWRV